MFCFYIVVRRWRGTRITRNIAKARIFAQGPEERAEVFTAFVDNHPYLPMDIRPGFWELGTDEPEEVDEGGNEEGEDQDAN